MQQQQRQPHSRQLRLKGMLLARTLFTRPTVPWNSSGANWKVRGGGGKGRGGKGGGGGTGERKRVGSGGEGTGEGKDRRRGRRRGVYS